MVNGVHLPLKQEDIFVSVKKPYCPILDLTFNKKNCIKILIVFKISYQSLKFKYRDNTRCCNPCSDL